METNGCDRLRYRAHRMVHRAVAPVKSTHKLYRDPQAGDPKEVPTYCKKCGDRSQIVVDTIPTYSIRTGRYVARCRMKCKNCSMSASERKKRQKHNRTTWVPIGDLKYVLDNQLGRETGDVYERKPRRKEGFVEDATAGDMDDMDV